MRRGAWTRSAGHPLPLPLVAASLQAWLQQALADRGAYDPTVHTTKATLVAALLGAAAEVRGWGACGWETPVL